ncbi:TonB-dependent receptor plug domain-containing protein [Acetobacter nitrogenifigens]|nr:TonB-dependent receptor [Acetobacter nitrogenifigens]
MKRSLLLATSLLTAFAGEAAEAAVARHPVVKRVATRAQTPTSATSVTRPATVVAPAVRTQTPQRRDTVYSGPGEEIIATGTRDTGRKARDSIAPIDIVTAKQLMGTGETDPARALTRLMPSLSMQAYGNDTQAFNSTIRMRGLSPNEVLILVDGQRRHQTSIMNFDTGPEQGTTPTDLDMIPASMIDHIEVLRDGAAAQYGSDAIAGVVNVILKKSVHKGSAYSQMGQTEAGDGFSVTAGGDYGFALGNDGFLRLSFDFKHQDHTNRTGPDNRNGTYDNKIMGQPEVTRETLGLNFGKDIIGSRLQFFGNITYGHRHGESYQNNRLASSLPAVYPHGYTPIQTDEENDYAANLGLKGDDLFGFGWKASTTWGADQANIGNKNTANLAYYSTYGYTPTSFDVGNYKSTQWTSNFDLTRSVKIPFMTTPVHFAAGTEYRYEQYDIGAGEYASYYGGGSQGLGGLTPASAGSHSRDVVAGYIDVDVHPVKRLDIDLAGRTEHYTDVGDTQNGKIAARYDFSRRAAIRASISSGFRAPTLAEEYFSNIITSPTGASGLLAVNSAGARSIGAAALKPERSTNASGGIVLEPVDNWHVGVDVYQINIRDRIVGGGAVNGASAVEAIEANGITLPSTASTSAVSATYLTNGASTRTQGLDITSDYTIPYKRYGTFRLNLAINLNRTTIHHMALNASGKPQLNAQLATYLRYATPRSKIILGVNWKKGRFDAMVRETRFGSVAENLTYYTGSNAYSTSVFAPFVDEPRWNTDIELGYQVLDRLHLAVGALNVTNIKPRKLPAENAYLGSYWYSTRSGQMGFNGGYYYARANYTF